jgi:hypothetical protein
MNNLYAPADADSRCHAQAGPFCGGFGPMLEAYTWEKAGWIKVGRGELVR